MIIVTRKYMAYDDYGMEIEEEQLKFFADDDVEGVQDFVDTYSNHSTFEFNKI